MTQIGRVVRRNRTTTTALGCVAVAGSCGILTVVLIFVAWSSIVGVGLRAAGFQPEGQTDDLFDATPEPTLAVFDTVADAQAFTFPTTAPLDRGAPTPSNFVAPPVVSGGGNSPQTQPNNTQPQNTQPQAQAQANSQSQAQNSAPAPSVSTFTISAGGYGTETLTNGVGAVARVGVDSNGNRVATLTATEPDLLGICRTYSPVCYPQGDGQIREARVELRNGGAIVRAEVNTGNAWLPVRVVVQANDTSLDIIGVDVGGTVYSAPPGEVGDYVAEAERVVDDVLRQVTVRAGGRTYSLRDIQVTEETVTLVLR